MKHIQVATNLRGPLRRETLQGREHIVVPAVLVRAKVLYNNLGRTLLPAEAITQAWADMANGTPVVVDHPNRSARSPDVLNALGVGTIFRARAENGALKADVYLDPARVNEVDDLRVILARLEKGEPVEGSTGFPVSVESAPGVHNGVNYDVVIYPTGFDHYAAFAEQVGACSVEDGCGLAQNRGEGCGCEGAHMEEENVLPEPPASPEEAVKNTGWRAFVESAAALLGLVKNSEEPGEPAERPAIEPEAVDPTPEEGSSMNRDQMIAKLAENGPLNADALNKLSDCQLKALLGANNAATPEGDGWDKAHEYRAKYEQLEAQTRNAREAEARERADLLDDLLYNARALPWGEQEIRSMDIVQLRKVHKLAFPKRASYAGLGGPAAENSSGSFDFVRPILDGPRGASVLDRKEAN